MKILIATSKGSKPTTVVDPIEYSKETIAVLKMLETKNIAQLAHILKVDEQKTIMEKKRVNDMLNEKAPFYEAINMFNGDMYKHLGMNRLDEKAVSYIEENVYIASALYGLIPSFYPVNEHRLDFINSLNLKPFWREEFDKAIKGETFVISMLSIEFEEVFSKEVRDKFIKIDFVKNNNGKLRKFSKLSKEYRGKLLRYMAENNIYDVEKIKEFKDGGFEYSEENSTPNRICFVKW